MSAWMVSHDHIDYIITAMMKYGGKVTADRAQELGEDLLRECERSVSYRYPDDTRNTLPGNYTADDVLQSYDNYTFREGEGEIEPVVAHQAVGSYQYQTCEHPGHENAESWELLTLFKTYLKSIVSADELDTVGLRGWDISRKEMLNVLL